MARADDYMLTAAELQLRTRRRRRIVVLFVVVPLLLATGYFAARPASNAIKGWQSRRHARKASELIEKEKWNEARMEATAAYQLRPSEPEAIRAVARFLSRVRQPQALEFWDQLEKVSSLSREDLREAATIALVVGDDARAERAIGALTKTPPAEPRDDLLVAQLAIHRKATAEVRVATRRIWKDRAATSREKLQAALLQLGTASDDPSARGEAWSWLKQLSQSNDAAALDALTVLAQTALNAEKLPDDFPIPAAEIERMIEAHPLARAPQKLLAIDLQLRADPTRHDELLGAAVQRWKAAEPADQLALATWLNGKGEFQRELDAIPLERALQTKELFLQHVDALGGLGRWSEIKDLLVAQSFPLDPVVASMYLARCNAQLGEKTASENNWQRALELAHGDVSKLMALAAYAEKNGVLEIAGDALDAAAAEAPKLRVAQQGRLRIAQAERDTKKIHAVLATMLELWPSDTAIQNDEAYTRLLLLRGGGTGSVPSDDQENAERPTPNAERQTPDEGGSRSVATASRQDAPPDDLAAIEQLATNLLEREPASLPHRTLLALARLKQNRAADALKVYEQINVPREALSASALAVHAAVLHANGNTADAKTEAAQVPLASLLPEERALIQQLL